MNTFRISDLFWFCVYGTETSLYTNRVKTEQWYLRIALLAQFFLDFWAWTTAWGYALPESTFWALTLGTVFAVAILVLDRSIIVHDTSGVGKNQLVPGLTVLNRSVAIHERAGYSDLSFFP